jgi:3-mercaptopyruvate sulfurtransferase SseA
VTLDQLQRRDARIAELEARGRARTRAEDNELGRLTGARDQFWRRLADQRRRALNRAAELTAYARQHGLDLERDAA